jgi:hypothetical protein
MSMTRISVPLSVTEREALRLLAQRELRDPREHVRYLLQRELSTQGMLNGNENPGAEAAKQSSTRVLESVNP